MGQKSFLQKSTPFNSIRIKWVFVNKYLEKEGGNAKIYRIILEVYLRVSCFAPMALPQLPTAFVIRAIAWPIRYSGIRSCKHGSFLAAVRDFHNK